MTASDAVLSHRNVFSHKKWRNIFIFQFLLPVGVILFTAAGLGNNHNNFNILLETLFNGELSLVSIFLIISTGLESPPRPSKIRGFALLDFWIPIVVLGTIFFVFNKQAVFQCGQCILENEAASYHVRYIVYNLLMTIALPIYCYMIVNQATKYRS